MPDRPDVPERPFRLPLRPLTDRERAVLGHRYDRAAHAVQTGALQTMQLDAALTGELPETSAGSPKHLRTGVDLRAAEMRGLVRLLIDKGVLTEDEYITALVWATETEVDEAEARLTERMGVKVSLG
jgi:hypothetical protein